jgi:hypothetical protein
VAAVILVGSFENLQKSVQDKVARKSSYRWRNDAGISIVKAFANEWYEIARYDGK